MIPHQVKMANLKDRGFKSSFFVSNTSNTTRNKRELKKMITKNIVSFLSRFPELQKQEIIQNFLYVQHTWRQQNLAITFTAHWESWICLTPTCLNSVQRDCTTSWFLVHKLKPYSLKLFDENSRNNNQTRLLQNPSQRPTTTNLITRNPVIDLRSDMIG